MGAQIKPKRRRMIWVESMLKIAESVHPICKHFCDGYSTVWRAVTPPFRRSTRLALTSATGFDIRLMSWIQVPVVRDLVRTNRSRDYGLRDEADDDDEDDDDDNDDDDDDDE
eukprot:1920932-Amphidinium_carterae.1